MKLVETIRKRKVVLTLFAIFFGLFGYGTAYSSYQGTLTYNGTLVQLSLGTSILMGLGFFSVNMGILIFVYYLWDKFFENLLK